MNKVAGVVESGRVVLPPGTRLPEGARVTVEWDEAVLTTPPPLEREPWTEEEVAKEIQRALRGTWNQ